MADARVAYDALSARADPSQIVLVGKSIGTGAAVKLAAEVRVAGVILDSGYSSILDIAMRPFVYLPVRLLLKDRWQADDAASSVTAPVFQVHWVDDFVMPIELGRRLNALFPNREALIEVPDRCHPVSGEGLDALMEQFKSRMFRISDSEASQR